MDYYTALMIYIVVGGLIGFAFVLQGRRAAKKQP